MKHLVVLLLLLICAGCREESGRAANAQSADDATARPARQRMHSLSVSGADAVKSQAAPGNSRATVVGAGATPTKIQSGSGNTQSMTVNADGGNVTQRQSGSGNSQSMNIGVVDGLPAQGSNVPRSQ